jgi:UPF0716 family protein affecting phage T7 exclusion
MTARPTARTWLGLAVEVAGAAVVEIVVIILVARAIGTVWTILALLALTAIGVWAAAREGVRAYRAS